MKVVLFGPVPRRGAGRLRQHFADRIEILEIADGEADDKVRAKLAVADVLISMRLDRRMPPSPKLKLLQLPVSGYDQVDFAALPEGAAVCNVYEHEVGIAEYVFAGMLEWTVGLTARSGRFKAGSWAESPRLSGATRGELAGKTVGLVGYGNIGRAVARRALAFDMPVLAVTRQPRELSPAPQLLGGYADLPRLLAEADFLVICCALAPATQGLIGAAQLAAMKPTAVLINVARGPIVDEDALYRALEERRIAGAVLDTWYRYADPDNPDLRPSRHPFHELNNVIMTPHLSGWTDGQQERRWSRIIENLEHLLAGRPLINPLRPEDG